MKKLIFLSLVIVLSLSWSCKKGFDEMQSNPNGFSSASDGSLFNNIIESLLLGWNEQFYVNNEVLYKQTQLAALASESWGNLSLGTEEIWTDYYTALSNIRELESRFNKLPYSHERTNMQSMLKVILAYKTFKLTDLFGDIPFSQAGWGFSNLENLRPKYDTQESIYKYLLEELKWASDSININFTENPFETFSDFDKLFNGDLSLWKKFANSLRLKHSLRMSDVSPQNAAIHIKEVIENDLDLIQGFNFTSYIGENVTLTPAELGFRNDASSWSFREHKNLRMGSNIWSKISENDSIDGSGIFDVRAYYFFETNNNDEWKAFPQNPDNNVPTIGGMPYQTHRDNAFSTKGTACIYSPFNYFLVRDQENMPEILLTGAEVHFIKAEIYMCGIGVPKDVSKAQDEYLAGLESSYRFWTENMENSTLPNDLGAEFFDLISVPSDLDFFKLQVKVGLWNFDTEDEKLNMIITQRWIDNFRQPWEAFAICRRTQTTPRQGDELNFFRLPYPPSESIYNTENWQNATSENSDATNAKVWWMK